MKNVFLKRKINFKKEHAKKYLLKYIKELKVHFDLTDEEIKDIVWGAFFEKSNLYHIIKDVRSFFKDKK